MAAAPLRRVVRSLSALTAMTMPVTAVRLGTPTAHPGAAADPDQRGAALFGGQARLQIDDRVATMLLGGDM